MQRQLQKVVQKVRIENSPNTNVYTWNRPQLYMRIKIEATSTLRETASLDYRDSQINEYKMLIEHFLRALGYSHYKQVYVHKI